MTIFRSYICLLLIALLSISCSHHREEEDDDHDHHEGNKGINPHQLEEFDIVYETVAPSAFHDVIKTGGVIQPSSSDITTVTAKKSGIITLSPDINVGSKVNAGERIGSISAEGMQGGDVNQAAIANLQAAKAEYERLKPLHEEGLVTTSSFREAERAYKEAQALAGKNLNSGGNSIVTSPIQGSIQNLFVTSGQYVEAGSPILTVAKNTMLILRADLPARDARHFAEIETANFIPEGTDEIIRLRDFNGHKTSSAASTNAINGYVPIYFSFTGNPLSFPGGYVEVFLICGERNGVISVPREALLEIQGNKYVYVNDDHHGPEKRLVKTGASDGERIEIIEGLNPGEEIVAKGASIVRMAEISAVAPPAHTHNH